ncbi:MAG: NADH-quinone oxidoreductase subunit NuoF [Armatimonadota bacterium]|nr:NADH-quinone oxidoreductase subunit NuoF [Armatimonadota bacterium]
MENILFKHLDIADLEKLDVYVANGGYAALGKALKELAPAEVTGLVTRSGLRGRGGAGFSTGKKWSFIPKDVDTPKYLTCNADESEPGTFKDRELMVRNPHQLLEGIALCCYAIGAAKSFIYIRGEYAHQARVMEKAIEEAKEAGYLGRNIMGSDFSLKVVVHRGAGAYICGEETALLDSLEGKKGWPRFRPPFPAIAGLYAKPTVINNVETLCNVPHIISRGPEWFASIGTEKSTGTKVFSVSGHVNKPGNYELPMGVTARELLFEHAGGIWGGRRLKAFIPGGASVPMLTESDLDVRLDFESVMAAGSMLGSGGVIVMNEDACIVWATLNLSKFYNHESCGKCAPCREGTYFIVQILKALEDGHGLPGDVEKLRDVATNIDGRSFCALGDAAAQPVKSSIDRFHEEYEYHIAHRGCMVGRS